MPLAALHEVKSCNPVNPRKIHKFQGVSIVIRKTFAKVQVCECDCRAGIAAARAGKAGQRANRARNASAEKLHQKQYQSTERYRQEHG